MMPLTADDFPAFFREVNGGSSPFPWQERLAKDVLQHGKWPECIDLPTGTGKTAVLDVAIFHLALEARRRAERRAPVRIALVVDRRLIVDQALIRAQKIRDALIASSGAIARRVAIELQFLAGEGNAPLCVQALRGGLPRESDWARTPVQPTILLSTVDQVGSRLLFRGYGISPSMRPIHAGLLGSDCLIFLDEAHLSEPFRQSLEWVERYRRMPWTEAAPAPWAVVSLSATPKATESGQQPFGLADSDKTHEVLGPRLSALKPAELREVPAANLAQMYAESARELAGQKGIQNVLIVVNRVDLARAIFEELAVDGGLLLTGRVREIDRERIVEKIDQALDDPERKLFAVATQCIEAGADYDFDALLTQIAPLDALRQRFGRLNRKGRPIRAQAVVLATKDDLRAKRPDAIYGFAAKNAWDFLKTIALSENKRLIVDFGSLAFNERLKAEDTERIKEACAERPDAPVMPPAYVGLWCCTNPPPLTEPDVPLFLHGPERATADVEVVWRADVSAKDFGNADRTEKLKEVLALAPPRPAETIAVPVWKVRSWLAGQPNAARFGDLEGERESDDEEGGTGRCVLRWCGAEDERTGAVSPSAIRPGDVIVVPADYGGCDEWGWTGRGEPRVDDIALASASRLKTPVIALRFHNGLFSDAQAWAAIRTFLEQYYDDPPQLRSALSASGRLMPDWEQELEQMEPGTEDVVLYVGDMPGLVLTGRRMKPRTDAYDPSTEVDTAGSFSRQVTTLIDHTQRVVAKAKIFADSGGLSERVRNALLFAADLHDSGKGDRRFQAYLRNGVPTNDILAKSKRRPTGAAEKRIRQLVGLPDRWRHEALSVRIAIGHALFWDAGTRMDRELALWLIGTHHGWGRPFFPHDDQLDGYKRRISTADGAALELAAAPGPQRLDFDFNGLDWAALFDCLQRRYGAWELARFEAFLRLADHRASEEA